MNFIPYTITDDFLLNPNAIRDWGLSLNYTPHPESIYPGKRTECLSTINPYFYYHLNSKILNLFFSSNDEYQFEAITHFHLSKGMEGKGWIHQDPAIFTSIIYLSDSDPNVNRGTSLYKLKPHLFLDHNSSDDFKIDPLRNEHYANGKLNEEKTKIKENYENSTFNKVLDVNDQYNRLICFDSSGGIYHSSNNLSSPIIEERLTLITFITAVQTKEMFPIVKLKKQSPL